MKKTLLRLVFLIFVIAPTLHAQVPASANPPTRNPISRFFSNLFDETRAEKAVGELLESALREECDGAMPLPGGVPRLASTTRFDDVLPRLAARSPRPGTTCRVLILQSPVPGEIPFPGGLIVLTSGIIDLAQTPDEQAFVLARNIMHVALRHPLMIMKREGLYARALRLLKQQPSRRDPRHVRMLLRDYLKAAAGMDQQRADREALTLVADPQAVQAAGIDLLKKCSQAIWPAMPWDWFDYAGRLEALGAVAPSH